MARQDLNDILGKAGDFQFSFAVEDLISPALDHIDRAADGLFSFFKKATKTVDKQMDKSQKWLKKFLRRDMGQAENAVEAVTEALQEQGRQAEDTEEKALSLGEAWAKMRQDEKFQEAFGTLSESRFKELADEYNSSLNSVANTLGKNRKQMVGLTEDIVGGVASQSMFAASSQEAMAALDGLVNAGVRNEKMLRDLAPRAAIVANAVSGDTGSITAAFYQMQDRVGLSGSQIDDVFSNWKKTSETVAISFESMQETFTDPEFYANFRRLTSNMSTETRSNMLATLGQIRGAFADEWADSSDFIGKIMEAMTDPRLAHQMQRMTGMTANQVQEMLQTTEGSAQFFSQFMDHVDKTAQSGAGTIKLWEETLGFASGSLLELQKESGSVRNTFKKLQDAQIGAGEGTAFLTQRAVENLSFTQKWGKALSQLASKEIPGLGFSTMDAFAVFADIPYTEIFAFGAILSSIASIQAPAFLASLAGLTGAGATLGGVFTAAAAGAWALVAPVLAVAGPVAAVAAGAYALYRLLSPLAEEFFKLEAVEDIVAGIADGFESIVGWLSDMPNKAKEAWNSVKQSLIEPLGSLGSKLNVQVPFSGGKTLGQMVGLSSVPELGDGGIATDPMLAKLAEEGETEVVMPLTQLGQMLSRAGFQEAAAFAGGGQAPAPNVSLNQERVVQAIMGLERTIKDLIRRTDLPSRGSSFGASPAGSPRRL